MNELALNTCKIAIKGGLGFFGGVVTGGHLLGVAAGVTLGEMYIDWCEDSLDLESEEGLAKYATTFTFSTITGSLGFAFSTYVLYDRAVKLGGEHLIQLFDGKVSFGNGETLAELCNIGSSVVLDKIKEGTKLDKYVRDNLTDSFELYGDLYKKLKRRTEQAF